MQNKPERQNKPEDLLPTEAEREMLRGVSLKCLDGKKYLVFYATLSDKRDEDGNKIIDTGLLTHNFPGESFFIVSREFNNHILRACEKMFNK